MWSSFNYENMLINPPRPTNAARTYRKMLSNPNILSNTGTVPAVLDVNLRFISVFMFHSLKKTIVDC